MTMQPLQDRNAQGQPTSQELQVLDQLLEAPFREQAAAQGSRPLASNTGSIMPQGVALQQPRVNPQVQALIHGALSPDPVISRNAYTQGVAEGVFDARLSPSAAAYYAQSQLTGQPLAGDVPPSVVKELSNFQTQEQALQGLELHNPASVMPR